MGLEKARPGEPWQQQVRSRIEHLGKKYEKAEAITDKWNCLRQIYKEALPLIQEAESGRRGRWINPYFVNWSRHFTPIEFDAWWSIWAQGVRLYPQVPVSRYFIDFANPVHRVGVELDGELWHERERDTARDEDLARLGWRIFRIRGKDAFKGGFDLARLPESPAEVRRQLRAWALETGDGVIRAVDAIFLRNKGPDYYSWWGDQPDYPNGHEVLGLFYRSLDEHRLVNFELPDLPEYG
jgi:REase_MTES_1575